MKNNKNSLRYAFDNLLLEKSNKKAIQIQIASLILSFKKELKRRKILCRTNFYKPDPSSKHGDFGSLEVSVDITRGRAKNMTKRSIEVFLRRLAEKINLTKFFVFSGSGENTDRFDVDFDLKDKYIEMFMNDELPLDIVDLNNTGEQEPVSLSNHIRLL